jgi:hypothetical protein
MIDYLHVLFVGVNVMASHIFRMSYYKGLLQSVRNEDILTERVCNALDFYSGGARFDSWPRHRPS